MNNKDYIYEMTDAFHTSFIDFEHDSNQTYRAEFVFNNPAKGKKVLVTLEQELSACEEFMISVAFINRSGITPLLQVFKELEKRGIPGKILTTDYLTFSEPKALEILGSLKNIELKMFRTNGTLTGFHTKGYIFKNENIYKIILGSSNITQSAITTNREWNTKLVSTKDGEFAQEVLREFDDLWNDRHSLDYFDFIDDYREEYTREQIKKKQLSLLKKEDAFFPNAMRLQPNSMQARFVGNLLRMKEQGINRALLLSSTGTGKTYASAFATQELEAQKILFVVHREQIAKQALSSYRRIFGKTKTYGLISGNSKEYDRQFIFATMQMMSKEETFSKFKRDEFDLIILDECHHAGAESYQRIIDYFEPRFLLGMTASPDTNNYDIYSIFDHQIAHEIRLQQALEEDLLCPFHYFGITELEIDGYQFNEQTLAQNFSKIVSDERVKHIIEQAEYYGFSGDRVKGLIFCSRKDEARELSLKFNQKGYRTEVLTGEDSQQHREEIIDRLTADENNPNLLDYIFSVDIFNEGVDVPEINQIIMLRPTESPVIFIQQLGRGLRKHNGKDYVVILDFIGNYTNNFMIPIALSGDRSYNKDAMRRYIREGARIIPGSSTIHFDEVAKTAIYKSIDAARTSDAKLLCDSYRSLKFKLGRIPRINDFKEYGSIDVRKFIDKYGSYYSFLRKNESDFVVELDDIELEIIEFLSKKLTAYKRIYDLVLLKELVKNEKIDKDNFWNALQERWHINKDDFNRESVYRNLTNQFPKEEEKIRYCHCVFLSDNEGFYEISRSFKTMLKNEIFKEMVIELLEYGIINWEDNYANLYRTTDFCLYQKYTYEDVCRLLGWEKNLNAQNIGGYFYEKTTKTMPVFINYDKTDDAIDYEDRFLSESSLIALSKHPRKIDSMDADHIYKRTKDDLDNRIYLFVRKNKDDKEAKEFYFLGEINAIGSPRQIRLKKTNDDAFEIDYRLDVPVRSDIYDYIVKE